MPLALVVALLIFLSARAAFADGCTDLGGLVVGTECQISSNVGNKNGTFNLDQSLHILDGGKIIVPPAANGNLLAMELPLPYLRTDKQNRQMSFDRASVRLQTEHGEQIVASARNTKLARMDGCGVYLLDDGIVEREPRKHSGRSPLPEAEVAHAH